MTCWRRLRDWQLAGLWDLIPFAALDVRVLSVNHCRLVATRRKLASELWSVQAGTATSTRIREGISNSVHVIRHDPAADRAVCLVEQWDFDEGALAFKPGPMTTVPLDRYL